MEKLSFDCDVLGIWIARGIVAQNGTEHVIGCFRPLGRPWGFFRFRQPVPVPAPTGTGMGRVSRWKPMGH
jgi:hypothetical protein